MNSNKRYYWLKLNETFFEDDTIEWIEEQENGEKYVLFYLKLCLKSLKDEGSLIRYVGEKLIPYDVKSLAKLTNTDTDTVRVALKVFEEIGLIERTDAGEIYMKQINEMIGTETDSARRVRKHRARENQLESTNNQSALHCNSDVIKCNREIEIELERELDLEKEIKTKTNTYTDRFNTFWEAYPKKIGKVASEKSFKKLKPSLELLNKMLETIEIFKKSEQWSKNNGQFIPNPATWLNQGRWDDEPGTNQEVKSGDKKWGDPDYYAIPDDYEGF